MILLHHKVIEAVNIIPLHSDLVGIIRAAEDFKELDEAIVRNFDVILLTTMNTIYKLHGALKESPFGDAGRQQVEFSLSENGLMSRLRKFDLFLENERVETESTSFNDVCRNCMSFIHSSPRV